MQRGVLQVLRAKLYGGSLIFPWFLIAAGCVGSTDPVPERSEQQNHASTTKAASSSTSAALIEQGTKVSNPPTPASTLPPARDPQIAVQEEFDAAKINGTVEAWDLFLARHNDNPLTLSATQERDRLVSFKKLKK